MPLILHFFKKDFRRVRVMLLLWVSLVVVQCAVMAWSLNPFDQAAHAAYGAVSTIMPVLQGLVLAVIVALVVQEEPPAGTTAFWLTRPMPKNAVLGSKFILICAVLCIAVFTEICVLSAAGSTLQDLARAALEILLKELLFILLAAFVAAVTPNFARFAIAATAVVAGMYFLSIGQGLISGYLPHDEAEFMKRGPMWSQSKQVAELVLAIASLTVALFYQYFTRRSGRSVAFSITAGLAIVGLGLLWRWDFFPSAPRPSAAVALDVSSIHTIVAGSDSFDVPGDRPTDKPKKSIGVEALLEGLPRGYFAVPRSARTQLRLPDGSEIRKENPRRGFYGFAPSAGLIEAELGSVFVYGFHGYLTQSPVPLAVVSSNDFRNYGKQKLFLNADIEFELERYIETARVNLAKGARIDRGSEHVFVTEILNRGNGLEVVVERRLTTSLFAASDDPNQSIRLLVQIPQNFGGKTYYLYNRKNRQMIKSQSQFGGPSSRVGDNSRLIEETLRLVFSNEPQPIPNLDEAWLADAELVQMEAQPCAEFAQSVALSDYSLDGSFVPKTALPPEPTMSPVWLTRFVLPAHPTKAQMQAYADDVTVASEYWRSDEQTELPVQMLSKVGDGNVDVLIKEREIPGRGFMSDRILHLAILRTAGQTDKDAVVRALPMFHDLVDLVVKYKWQAECRDTLIATIRDPQQTLLPRAWVIALAMLRDPSIYPDLKAFLIRGNNRQATYNQIKILPGIELRDTVDAAWKQAKQGTQAARVDGAKMAVDLGYLDALETLVDVLRADDPGQAQLNEQAMTLVRRYTPAKGDRAALVAWYDANRGKLSFDTAEGKYLPKAQP